MKTDFKPYKIGTVFNPIKTEILNVKPIYKVIKIKFPSRLNAMAIDPSKIASNKNLIYTPGEIVFSVAIYKHIEVKIIKENDSGIVISKNSKRKPLIHHAYLLMKKALKFKDTIYINARNEKEIRHCGLGSSGGLIAGIACAINEIYGNPIDDASLVRYLTQNHGEEIDGRDDIINPVQCIGGSAASGIFRGGLLILAGDSCVIKTMDIDNKYKVVIGIPKDFTEQDSKILLEKEIGNLDKFIKTGKKFGPIIAYNILHKVMPAITKGNIRLIGDVIFDYRFKMGSIKNCSFAYPKIVELTNKLSFLKTRDLAEVLSISSVGPAIFAITQNSDYCSDVFKKFDLIVFTTTIENNKYKVISRNNE